MRWSARSGTLGGTEAGRLVLLRVFRQDREVCELGGILVVLLHVPGLQVDGLAADGSLTFRYTALVPAPTFILTAISTPKYPHTLSESELACKRRKKVKLPVKITLEYTYCCFELRDLTEIHHVSMLTPGTDIQL